MWRQHAEFCLAGDFLLTLITLKLNMQYYRIYAKDLYIYSMQNKLKIDWIFSIVWLASSFNRIKLVHETVFRGFCTMILIAVVHFHKNLGCLDWWWMEPTLPNKGPISHRSTGWRSLDPLHHLHISLDLYCK